MSLPSRSSYESTYTSLATGLLSRNVPDLNNDARSPVWWMAENIYFIFRTRMVPGTLTATSAALNVLVRTPQTRFSPRLDFGFFIIVYYGYLLVSALSYI